MTTLDDISGRPGALVYIYEIVFNFFQGVGVLNRGDGKRGNRGFVEQSNATQPKPEGAWISRGVVSISIIISYTVYIYLLYSNSIS